MNVEVFLKTLVKIIETRENVEIDFKIERKDDEDGLLLREISK